MGALTDCKASVFHSRFLAGISYLAFFLLRPSLPEVTLILPCCTPKLSVEGLLLEGDFVGERVTVQGGKGVPPLTFSWRICPPRLGWRARCFKGRWGLLLHLSSKSAKASLNYCLATVANCFWRDGFLPKLLRALQTIVLLLEGTEGKLARSSIFLSVLKFSC